MTAGQDPLTDRLLDAVLAHVVFDGWSDAALMAAASDIGVTPDEARAVFPRGAVDMALAFHDKGDQAMVDRLTTEPLDHLKFREKIAAAVRFRLEAVEDRELVRRGTTLFALPQNAADGARAVWADLRSDLDNTWRHVGRSELVHQTGNAFGRVFFDGSVLAGRYQP